MSSEEEEFNDSNPAMNGDVEEGEDDNNDNGGRKRRSSRGAVSYNEADEDFYDDEEEEDNEASGGDDEEDDDDDVPLASLKSSSPTKKKKTTPSKTRTAKPPATKKKKPTTSSATKATSSSNATTTTTVEYASPSFALYGSECKKGELIQKLLCRWWYAITWPDPATLPDKPPPHYDAMDGFPGVYVCTAGEEVGTIKDMRDKSKAPNFNNFAKMKSEELRDLLIKAIQEQKRQLIAAEGAGTGTEKELNVILKWAEKVNTDKADKDAAKILKASKLTLAE
ncbi:hypothetical protein IV203_014797 [Nitzschia inconspicua]|uniref:Uncharacterized protein n=1 Tax=Nitzschia inconspicua TaxID=303405 RepID=A0A9K3P8M1_9STRA|nr:hypothetical protein IV203_020262 [Nitzschia inconspicua]KAG7358210.1 hypothetical protein IV203_014797 [Nitzschia inconspicua]